MSVTRARILVACEFSGTVRDAFRAIGHDASSCDLLPTEKPGPHFQCDAREVLGLGWDLMVCHPPCTYLTCSAEWAYKDPDFVRYPDKGGYHQRLKPGTLFGAARRAARKEAVEFCRALLSAPVPRIALENPRGHLSSAIRKPDQTIQPHQFGEDASKGTCLWLLGLPLLVGTGDRPPRMVTLPGGKVVGRWGNQTDSGQNNVTPDDGRWAARSLTYPGIAAAMADQWGRIASEARAVA